MSERRLDFNVTDLREIIAKAVGLPQELLGHITKLAEGGSYRIFEATFGKGFKVIARLPYPCTIPRKYGIASEVATMEFLRIHNIPVPIVFDWSSSASNKLGSEYIIMERARGRELIHTWSTMTLEERRVVVKNIVDIEKQLFSIRFPANGSLFFKDSLDPSIKSVDIPKLSGLRGSSRFCIGPSTEYLWWYQRRNELAVNHGPCEDPYQMICTFLAANQANL